MSIRLELARSRICVSFCSTCVHSSQALLEKEQQEIQEVFAALTEGLKNTEEVLLAPLEDGRRCLEKDRDEKTQQIQKDILKYKEAIESLNRNKNEEDDVLFIQVSQT